MAQQQMQFEYRWRVVMAECRRRHETLYDSKFFATCTNGVCFYWNVLFIPRNGQFGKFFLTSCIPTECPLSPQVELFLDKAVEVGDNLPNPNDLPSQMEFRPNKYTEGKRWLSRFPAVWLEVSEVFFRIRIALTMEDLNMARLLPHHQLIQFPLGLAFYQQTMSPQVVEGQDKGDICILSSDNQTISCHQVALEQNSEVFKRMFQLPLMEAQKREVQMMDTSSAGIRDFLYFLYVGVLAASVGETVGELVNLAEKYQVGPLKAACHRWMVENMCKERATEFLQSACRFNLSTLKMKASVVICQHWQEMVDRVLDDLSADKGALKAVMQLANMDKAYIV